MNTPYNVYIHLFTVVCVISWPEPYSIHTPIPIP